MGEVFQAEAAAGGADFGVIFGADAVFHSCQAAGDAGDDVVFGVAEGDGLQQALEADAELFLHGAGVGFVLLAHADGVDDDEVVLGLGVGGDGDPWVVAVAEGLDKVLRGVAGGAVSDLLGEFVALAEFLAQDFDDVFGVVVVLGE